MLWPQLGGDQGCCRNPERSGWPTGRRPAQNASGAWSRALKGNGLSKGAIGWVVGKASLRRGHCRGRTSHGRCHPLPLVTLVPSSLWRGEPGAHSVVGVGRSRPGSGARPGEFQKRRREASYRPSSRAPGSQWPGYIPPPGWAGNGSSSRAFQWRCWRPEGCWHPPPVGPGNFLRLCPLSASWGWGRGPH